MSVFLSPRLVDQRPPERVAYTINATIYGGSPTGVVVTLWEVTTAGNVDVSSTNLSGAATVDGNVITTPLVIDLVPGTNYLVEIKFTAGGNTWAPLGQLRGVA
jgi:hypothetical protein